MGIWSGTPDKPIYADLRGAQAGLQERASGEFSGLLSNTFDSALGALAGQQQNAFQGKTPLAAAGVLSPILDRIFGQEVQRLHPKFIKEGSQSILGGLLSQAGQMTPLFFGGGGKSGFSPSDLREQSGLNRSIFGGATGGGGL